MDFVTFRRVISALCLCFVIAPSVFAEIYQCRNADGGILFTQTPCSRDTITGDTEAHKLWREMQVLVNRGQNINNKLGADLQSIIDCKNNVKAYAADLDLLDTRLRALPAEKSKYLLKAQHLLRECGQCRASAPEYCHRASKQLDQQMNVLLPPLSGK